MRRHGSAPPTRRPAMDLGRVLDDGSVKIETFYPINPSSECHLQILHDMLFQFDERIHLARLSRK